ADRQTAASELLRRQRPARICNVGHRVPGRAHHRRKLSPPALVQRGRAHGSTTWRSGEMTPPDGPRWHDHPAPDQTQIDRVIIALAAGALLALVLLARGNPNKEGNPWPMHGPNDRSRWATVYSLAERGTYDID